MSKKVLVPAAVVVLAGVVAWFVLSEEKANGPKFRKEKVERGDVVAVVTASGTLSAVITVKVGSQVSGIISRLHANFNSEVKKGQLLAELDPTPFQTAVEQRRADLQRARVQLQNAELVLRRAKSLLDQQLQAQADYDTARTQRDAAAADVAQSEGALRQAETNLAYTRIVSPIDGVVVDRQYDIGQTVAASFQAPTLFTIAQDLTKMQVLTNIDEADIGRVKESQDASFTVDAFPDRSFRGTVSQIRLSPQTVQNVVTYPVVIDVPNPKLELRPGMTANVTVPVDRREGTLRVANAALRYRPDPALLEKAPSKAGSGGQAAGAASPGGAPAGDASAAPRAERRGGDRAAGGAAGREGGSRGGWAGASGNGSGRPGAGAPGGAVPGRRPGGRSQDVYVELPGGKLKAVAVKTSITDGNFTAVESEELKEGMEVIVGLSTAKAMAGSGGGSPMGGGPGGGRGPGRM